MKSCDIMRHPGEEPTVFHGVVTVSPQMKDLFGKLQRVARTDSTVLIRGESGTGKELVAKALHECSPRSERPFRAVNCATFTADLIGSELFGHKRGAFTGAVRDHPGLLAQADTGSIFLDEVAELPLDIQARLLRVLQERTYVPLGATSPESVDVRLVSATNRGLRDEVAAGRFREDLMYRVRVVTLFLPRLAERAGDVAVLTWHFIDEYNRQGFRRITRIEAAAVDALCSYAWPGNVRELRNNIESAFAVGEGDTLRLEELAPELQESPPDATGGSSEGITVTDIERERLIAALRASGGRRNEAAAALGVSRSTLWRKLKKHGLA